LHSGAKLRVATAATAHERRLHEASACHRMVLKGVWRFWSSLPASRRDKVEPVKIHHPVPGSHEVAHKRLLRVAAGIDFRDGSEL
jgi:hypothetical protein